MLVDANCFFLKITGYLGQDTRHVIKHVVRVTDIAPESAL